MALKTGISKLNLGICLIFAIGLLANGCSGDVNTNQSEYFTLDGHLIPDTTTVKFHRDLPQSVNFYIEVSGSMNGFFRANRPTDFKTDVWNILSSFSPIASQVTILTNDGSQGATLPIESFRTSMNTGAFVSSSSTKVPLMLKTIINNLDTEKNEAAVLISDMKYSPVGASAPAVLMSQYTTDINNIMNKFGKAISIICATSDYLDKTGNIVTERSPYYFVILGNQENVAEIRNHISLLLYKKGHFVDNIESGFNYGYPEYAFGIPRKCNQLDSEPTFIGYEEADAIDTCTIKIKVPLENYRWIMADEDIFREAFQAKTSYGSKCEMGNLYIETKDVTGAAKNLNREATAFVDLKIYDMPTGSEIIEWNLDLPTTNYSLFQEFFENATDENDPNKSYSVLNFLKGIFEGGLTTHDMRPNHILISRE